MKLEERLRQLAVAEGLLDDGDTILRLCLLKPRNEQVQREKGITEALFKIRGAKRIVKSIKISGEMKQKRKNGGLVG